MSAARAPLQPVQLQKALFLLSKNVPRKVLGRAFYVFEPYDYGPFCKAIYDDAIALEISALAEIGRPVGMRFNTYAATPAGKSVAAKLREELLKENKDVVDYLDRVVTFVQSVSFSQLVGAIYKAYPEMRAKSVFRG